MKFKLLPLAAISCLLITSCKNDDQIINGGTRNIPASFNGSINEMTRVSGTSWDSEDKIGIYMLQNDEILNGIANYCYTTSAGDGIFEPFDAAQTIYYPINKSKVNFIAYHPFKEMINENFIVSNWNSIRQDTLDLLVAKATGHSQSNPEVSFGFYHQFSKLVIKISADSETGLTNKDLAGLSISIKGINKPTSFNILTKDVSYMEELNEEVFMQVSADGLTAEAIIPSISGTDITITLVDGSTYTWDISNYTFEKGKCYPFSITLKAAPNYVEATLGSIIYDWNTEESTEISLDQTIESLVSGNHNGHDYVDLDLPSGALWSTMNVGANSPEESGSRYAWGETEIKDSYTPYNYKFFTTTQNYGFLRSAYMNKYLEGSECDVDYRETTQLPPSEGGDTETADAVAMRTMANYLTESETSIKKRLDPEDDAAHIHWGGSWRIPTAEEWIELIENTRHSTIIYNGVEITQLVGKNGKAIYLAPFGIFNTDSYPSGYWSSDGDIYTTSKYTKKEGLFYKVFHIFITNSSISITDTQSSLENILYTGLGVRPIFSPSKGD